METWKKMLPLGLGIAGAAAAVAVLMQKKGGKAAGEKAAGKPETKAAGKAPAKGKNAPKPPKNPKTGVYSFISGYQDAATVEVEVPYDGDRFDFQVVENGFLCDTSDSHVAVMEGADFNLQLEYASYYPGEGFDKLSADAGAAHGSFAPVAAGFRTIEGDSVCVRLPVDAHSYLLINVLLAKGSNLKFPELPEAPELLALLEGIRVK